jgi:spermidine synthase
MASLDVVVDQLIEQPRDARPCIYSVRVRSPLTLRYWDYLAWAIEQVQPRRLLLLGLGGGTVLQLLERRGVVPPCVAIDLDPQVTDALRARGWLTYPQLEVVHEDARSFVSRQPATETFDAIVVDVYDEHGYVRELYDPPLLRRLVRLLSPGGVLLLHCLDPMAKFPAFRMVMPERPFSPSCSVAQHLASLGMQVAAYPMWSSMLIASARDPLALDWSTARPAADQDLALAWSRQFHARRHTSLAELQRFLQPLEGAYSCAHLERLDGEYLVRLAAAAPMLRAVLPQPVGIPAPAAPAPANEPAAVRELGRSGERALSTTTVRTAIALKMLLEQTAPGAPDGAPLVEAIRQTLRADGDIALSHVESFATAWGGDFAGALASLRGNVGP